MTISDYLPKRLLELGCFFREELTEERPGRVAQAMQLASLSLLVTLVSMTFRVPALAVSLIVLFYGIQTNSFYTKVVGVLFLLVTCVNMGTSMLIMKIAYGYPLVRIVFGAFVLFVCMYLVRANKLGVVFLSIGMVVFYTLTAADTVDFPEIFVRVSLWSLVATVYPVVLMVVICCVLFPSRPVRQLQREVGRQLADVLARFQPAANGASQIAPLPVSRVEKDAAALKNLHPFCCGDDRNYKGASGYWTACIASVVYLRATANMLSARLAGPGKLSEAGAALLHKLRAATTELNAAVARAEPWQSQWRVSEAERRTANEYGLDGACETLERLAHFDLSQPAPPAEKESLFMPDALRNPAYLRFAFKVTLAAMICYAFYQGAEWSGIHTSMVTCGVVAYPSTGASFQKMILRVAGAVAGALLALVMAIFVNPHLDGIFGLLLALAPIFFLGGWIASGSERSNYIGTQMVFTFGLAMLENFGPVTDITEVRDRAFGILIGSALACVLYTQIWPESEMGAIRQKLADMLNQLGKLVRQTGQEGDTQFGYLQQRIACWDAFRACQEMRERIALEVDQPDLARQVLLRRTDSVLAHGRGILDDWEALHNDLVVQRSDRVAAPAWQAWRDRVATVLDRYADGLLAESVTAGCAGTLSTGPAPGIARCEQSLARQVAQLPDWTMPDAGAQAAPSAKVS